MIPSHISIERAKSILSAFSKTHLLVVGDVMVDQYIWGKVTRISPEAPVPVVEIVKENLSLGGATNVVKNIRALGGHVSVCGVVGNDAMGKHVLDELSRLAVYHEGLLVDPTRPTSLKTRIIAQNQQVLRCDREVKTEISPSLQESLIQRIENDIQSVQGIILSDYRKGVMSRFLVEGIRNLAESRPIMVDPKVENFSLYQNVTMITPNQHEAEDMAGFKISTPESIEQAGQYILQRLNCQSVLITRGNEGMSLFEQAGNSIHIPTMAREVYDVTGAGDTVIATFTLAHLSGANMWEAAFLSNLAAGIVVGKVGTATVTPEELLENLQSLEEGE